MQTFCHFLSCWPFEFDLFVVEMKNLKNNCLFNPETVNGRVEMSNCMYIICFDVIRSTGNMLYFAVKNKSISDIAVLLLKIKPLQNYVLRRQSVSGSIVLGFLLCDIIS